jgi:glycine/D-amino acid oxidase-like deaminating enzyme/nitrite reductase/ring-hydroxylating ferredoxin subunit
MSTAIDSEQRVETTRPVWLDDVEMPRHPPLAASRKVDVCIVGAGIAGLSIAYELLKRGRQVLVIDQFGVAAGQSGQTSAHLASGCDDGFVHLEKVFGTDRAKLFHNANAAGIDAIERVAAEEAIDCNFRRVDGYFFSEDGDALVAEMEAAYACGFVEVQKLDRAPVDGYVHNGMCLRYPRQAAFQPATYLAGLARAIEKLGGEFAFGDRAIDMQTLNGKVVVAIDGGKTVLADVGVCATNVPALINNWPGVYTKQAAYRTLMIAFEVNGEISDALYWDDADPYHYARLCEIDGRRLFIVGGEDFRVGQADDYDARYERLEAWSRERFPSLGTVVRKWSGQVNEPDDFVALIGRAPTSGHENVYVVTGDSGMGLTQGAFAGLLIPELIEGKESPWQSLFDPGRTTTSLRVIGDFVRENVSSVARYADYLTAGSEVSTASNLAPGQAAIIAVNGHRIAAYRDDAGTLHQCSAMCTHLKGLVRWNPMEKSWDCPVHGSRFDCNGKPLQGPAVDSLPPA